jgi:hypothetical protein
MRSPVFSEANMPGHVTIQTQIDGVRDFEIVEASWSDGRVEVHLRNAGGSPVGDVLRLRLDGGAVTEIVGAVTRFATDADLGVLE